MLLLDDAAVAIVIAGFGSHFSMIYKPLFYFAPFFSKFRVPSMIYMMLSLIIPMLAAISLDKMINQKNKRDIFSDSLKLIGIFAKFFQNLL